MSSGIKNGHYWAQIHQNTAFLPLYTKLLSFLLPGHECDPRMLENKKNCQKMLAYSMAGQHKRGWTAYYKSKVTKQYKHQGYLFCLFSFGHPVLRAWWWKRMIDYLALVDVARFSTQPHRPRLGRGSNRHNLEKCKTWISGISLNLQQPNLWWVVHSPLAITWAKKIHNLPCLLFHPRTSSLSSSLKVTIIDHKTHEPNNPCANTSGDKVL